MLLIMIVFAPLGNVMLGKGMKNVGTVATWAPSELLHVASRVFMSGYVCTGLALSSSVSAFSSSGTLPRALPRCTEHAGSSAFISRCR
jgi:hypothetical protein